MEASGVDCNVQFMELAIDHPRIVQHIRVIGFSGAPLDRYDVFL